MYSYHLVPLLISSAIFGAENRPAIVSEIRAELRTKIIAEWQGAFQEAIRNAERLIDERELRVRRSPTPSAKAARKEATHALEALKKTPELAIKKAIVADKNPMIDSFGRFGDLPARALKINREDFEMEVDYTSALWSGVGGFQRTTGKEVRAIRCLVLEKPPSELRVGKMKPLKGLYVIVDRVEIGGKMYLVVKPLDPSKDESPK